MVGAVVCWAVLGLATSVSAEDQKEGNWFYSDTLDTMTKTRDVTLGVVSPTNDAITFHCENPGTRKAKIIGIFVSKAFLGEARHLQFLFLKFDDEDATRMVGQYPGHSIAYLQDAKAGMKAFNRIEKASRVQVRAFRYDDTPVEADIPVSPERVLWAKFKATCLGT
jgi:hypothetical protein